MGGREVRKGKENGEIFDHFSVEFEYPDGTRMLSQCRHIPGCWDSVSEHVVGTKGTCDVGRAVITGANEWRFSRRGNRDPYQQEHDSLFDAIRNNKPFNEAFYGAYSSMLAVLGRMATYSGKEISWDDAFNSQRSVMPERFAWDAQPPLVPDAEGFYPVAVPGRTVTV
jgi:hypothetical protein